MIAQKHRPLATLGDRRGLLHDVDDRKAVLHLQRHEHARHEWKVETHVRLVAFAEIRGRVLRPLIGLRQQHPIWKFRIDVGAQSAEILMRFREILTVGVFAFVKIRHRVQTKTIYTHGQPEVADLLHGIVDSRIIKVQVRLVRIKPVPIVCFCNRVPRPVRCFEVFENNSRILVFFWCIAPDVEVLVGKIVTVAGAGDPGRSCATGVTDSGCSYGATRLLEPWILIGSMIDHQFGDHAQIARMRRIQKSAEIVERAKIRIDVEIVGNVVAVVALGRRIERQQPDGGDPQLLEIIQFFHQTAEVTHPVAIAVTKRLDVQLVDDGVLVPTRIHRFVISSLCHAINF